MRHLPIERHRFRFLLCRPTPMTKGVEHALATLGIPTARRSRLRPIPSRGFRLACDNQYGVLKGRDPALGEPAHPLFHQIDLQGVASGH